MPTSSHPALVRPPQVDALVRWAEERAQRAGTELASSDEELDDGFEEAVEGGYDGEGDCAAVSGGVGPDLLLAMAEEADAMATPATQHQHRGTQHGSQQRAHTPQVRGCGAADIAAL